MPRVRGKLIEAKRDGNHAAVVGWYEQLGCSVIDLSTLGGGISDLLIGAAGLTDLAEVKLLGKDLRPNQVTFNDRWRGSRPWKVQTLDDVQAHVSDMRRRARLLGSPFRAAGL